MRQSDWIVRKVSTLYFTEIDFEKGNIFYLVVKKQVTIAFTH
jgi:hypothetical protein